MTTYDFAQFAQPLQTVPFRQSVSIKTQWSGGWTPFPYLHAEEVSGSVMPSLSTGTFVWRYGWVEQVQSLNPAIYAKLSGYHRVYVRVVYDTPDPYGIASQLTWYGVLEMDTDELGGILSGAAGGMQTLTALGTEILLSRHVIKDAWFRENGNSYYTENAPDFNARGKPNRTAAKVGSTYLFEPNEANASYWSTHDIIEYLLQWQSPTDSMGNRTIPFRIGNANGLSQATWDKPTVQQAGRTTLDIVHEIVNRRRMLNGWWSVNDASGEVTLNTNTLTATAIPISLPGASPIPANSRQHALQTEADPKTRLAMKTSDLAVYDQVVCRGAVQKYVATFSPFDANFNAGWDTNLQSEYHTAASNDANYGNLSLDEKRRLNAEFRSQPRFRDVYALWKIPPHWDRTVSDGQAGIIAAPLFGNTGLQPFYGDMFVEQQLPLLTSVDYSGNKIANDTVDESTNTDGSLLGPIVLIKNEFGRWVQIGGFAAAGDSASTKLDDWSGNVEVPPESHGLRIHINGRPQHYLDGHTFNNNKLAADIEAPEINPAAGDMMATIALPGPSYCEAAWPVTIPGGIDAVRVRVFDMGPSYTKDYVAPQTVVGVKTDGTIQRSDGGWIPKPGASDNVAILRALARQLHAYYSVQRRVLQLDTPYLFTPSQLGLGDLITSIGYPSGGHYAAVNSYVSQITIRSPEGEQDDRLVPTFHVTTAAGEMDPVSPRPFAPSTPPQATTSPVAKQATLSSQLSHFDHSQLTPQQYEQAIREGRI